MRPAIFLIGAAAALLNAAGCGVESKGGGLRPVTDPSASAGASSAPAAWPFVPARLSIHPLTRVVRSGPGSAGATIDAHVELRDAAGDEVKGVGRLVFELERDGGGIEGMTGRERISRWETDLTDLAANSSAYDRVTRTYRFQLTGLPEDMPGARRFVLRATLTPPGPGATPLSAEHSFIP
ncbi:MAG: hypothetical protein SFZ24_11895 [Planctomycetota bacterium]|nr:hypothetical protein [Planctomycetota bacterium]